MRLSIICGLLMAAGVSPALASGGISCAADASGVTFQIAAGVTHGPGGQVFGVNGQLQTQFKGISPDLLALTYGDGDITEFWLDAKTLNVLAYVERDATLPHGYTALTITTSAVDEGLYEGRYSISSYEVLADEMAEPASGEAQGDVTCMAD